MCNKKRTVDNLVSALIEERENLINILVDVGGCKLFQRCCVDLFSSKKISMLVHEARDGGLSVERDLEMHESMEEIAFQISQCHFASYLLKEEKYDEICRMLSYFRDVTYQIKIPVECRRISHLFSLKEIRKRQIDEVIAFLSQ
ncbi:MAG: hypothetical protein PHW24_05310 [Candidatus Moranbacteria bacterium]|nr:hypothetical protein [Candidatus Moranbacteria bacterium]